MPMIDYSQVILGIYNQLKLANELKVLELGLRLEQYSKNGAAYDLQQIEKRVKAGR